MFWIVAMTDAERRLTGEVMAALAMGGLGACLMLGGVLRQRRGVPTTPAQARFLRWGGLALVVASGLKLVAFLV